MRRYLVTLILATGLLLTSCTREQGQLSALVVLGLLERMPAPVTTCTSTCRHGTCTSTCYGY